MKLVVGIGNPGPQYVATRHNIGFDVADILCARFNASWRGRWQGLYADIRDTDRFFLLKPGTYVNLSGNSVRELAGYYQIPAEDVLVISDDFNLPVAKIRIRTGGSDGGHNGLMSVIGAIGDSFVRLRVGIGTPNCEAADYVLMRFLPEERTAVDVALQVAADSAVEWVRNGFKAAAEIVANYNSTIEAA
jgi:peptidyl-tRNA hydrolase, PTH1 family